MAAPVLDVLCVGHASFDQVFTVPHHPLPDEKLFAESLALCGGGPAANAAIQGARLGVRTGFSGYLGNDVFGEAHLKELKASGVDVRGVIRGALPTPLSTVLVKPGGARSLVNFKGETRAQRPGAVDYAEMEARVLLFDGHEPGLSESLLPRTAPKVLDAGSLHAGTLRLMGAVDHLVASEKFAREWLGRDDPPAALQGLSALAPVVVAQHIKSGKLRALGVAQGKRVSIIAEVPTFAEAGNSALALAVDAVAMRRVEVGQGHLAGKARLHGAAAHGGRRSAQHVWPRWVLGFKERHHCVSP